MVDVCNYIFLPFLSILRGVYWCNFFFTYLFWVLVKQALKVSEIKWKKILNFLKGLGLFSLQGLIYLPIHFFYHCYFRLGRAFDFLYQVFIDSGQHVLWYCSFLWKWHFIIFSLFSFFLFFSFVDDQVFSKNRGLVFFLKRDVTWNEIKKVKNWVP